MALLDRAIVRVLPAVPRPVVKRLSQRYIAGPDLEDACHVVGELNEDAKMATIDVLGEEITSRDEATALLDEYEEVFETIEREGLDSNVSVKLTGLGLKLDRDFCRDNLAVLVRDAAKRANFVRIDMEDSSTTDDTLAIYRELRAQGLENVGIVLQAYMKRTLTDIAELADLRPNVRVCKGIYVEPPEVAYQEFDTVRINFVEAVEALFDLGAYVGIATHDDWVQAEVLTLLEERGMAPEQYEFQMLLGVRPELGDELVREGHRLRIYVPFGRQWYEYSLRRLQENPKIAGYIALDTLKRLKP
ncbi:MAG TPA: proline dehydrogenase family protein [Gaiellaceae bacterium]|nr:proline dehydrogenase family protein [Gaiellaceae bacterium]